MLDFGWADWVQGQVERVWDLMDISLHRSAIVDIDPAFKTWVYSSTISMQISQFISRYTVRFGTSLKMWIGQLALGKSEFRLV